MTVGSRVRSRRGPRGVQALLVLAVTLLLVLSSGVSPQVEPAQAAPSGSGRINVVSSPIGQRSDGTNNVHPGSATFSPARPGRPVHVYRQVGGQWRWVVSGTQDRNGTATFSVPASALSGPTPLRAETVPGGRAARVVSSTQVVTPLRRTFSDDFTGSRLDASKWGTRFQPYMGSRLCSRPARDRVKVSGGVATLSVRKIARSRVEAGRRTCTAHGVWDNAMISTANATQPFLQKYGVFAARVAHQDARGMHSAFWLQGPSVTGSEIDVVEHFGTGHPSALTTKLHYTPASGKLQSATTGNLVRKLRGRPATGYNVYSVEWTPTQYVFRINGIVSWVAKKPRISSAEQEVILSLLTSDWNLPALKRPGSTMKVDWVRVWQYPGR